MISQKYMKLGIATIAGLGLFLGGCDDVKENDRYIPTEAVTVERNVLLEDFTGQNCLNCPVAHETIEQLEEQYGREHLIAVSVHSGGMAKNQNRNNFLNGSIGLMNEESQKVADSYTITSWPMGVVNMSGSIMNYPEWPAAVSNAIKTPTDVEIHATVKYEGNIDGQTDEELGTITVTAKVTSQSERKNARVQFWITEDNIVAEQKLPDSSMKMDYVHNNVFRAMIFGKEPNENTRGKVTPLAAGVTETVQGNIQCRYNKKEVWKINNLYVIAFVYDGGVQNVVRVKVIPEQK